MKRKINRVGQNTLTVSLPSKWAKKHNLHAGDEIELIEEENKIELKLGKEIVKKSKKISLNIDGMDNSCVFRYVFGAYRKGFTEIKITFSDENIPINKSSSKAFNYEGMNTIKILDLIEKIISRGLVGMDVIEVNSDSVILKEIAETKVEDFDSSLKRLYYILKKFCNDLFDYFQDKEIYENVFYSEVNANKFSDYCIRLQNKIDYDDIHDRVTTNNIVRLLELFGDILLEITNIKKHNEDFKPSKETLDYFKELCIFLDKFYVFMFSYDMNNISGFYNHWKLIRSKQSKTKDALNARAQALTFMCAQTIADVAQLVIETKL